MFVLILLILLFCLFVLFHSLFNYCCQRNFHSKYWKEICSSEVSGLNFSKNNYNNVYRFRVLGNMLSVHDCNLEWAIEGECVFFRMKRYKKEQVLVMPLSEISSSKTEHLAVRRLQFSKNDFELEILVSNKKWERCRKGRNQSHA